MQKFQRRESLGSSALKHYAIVSYRLFEFLGNLYLLMKELNPTIAHCKVDCDRYCRSRSIALFFLSLSFSLFFHDYPDPVQRYDLILICLHDPLQGCSYFVFPRPTSTDNEILAAPALHSVQVRPSRRPSRKGKERRKSIRSGSSFFL